MRPVRFGSAEWLQALRDELNRSQDYADAARNWEGDFYFLVDPEGPVAERMYMYVDLWHGKCREARVVQNPSTKTPAYVMSGPYSKWKKVVTGQLDPLQAMATGQLKLKGNMIAIMKHVKAAQEIVRACTRIETEFI